MHGEPRTVGYPGKADSKPLKPARAPRSYKSCPWIDAQIVDATCTAEGPRRCTGSVARLELLRNFGDAQANDIAQQKHPPLSWREMLQCRDECELGCFMLDVQRLGTGCGRPRCPVKGPGRAPTTRPHLTTDGEVSGSSRRGRATDVARGERPFAVPVVICRLTKGALSAGRTNPGTDLYWAAYGWPRCDIQASIAGITSSLPTFTNQ